jgi:hypothetical protein
MDNNQVKFDCTVTNTEMAHDLDNPLRKHKTNGQQSGES